MSMTHDGAPMVQLESQTQLLDSLQRLTHQNSNLICVEGEPGSGKSWLAQRFLNTDKVIQTLSFLICLPSQTAEQQRSVLLGQLLSDSFCTGEETLLESLKAFRKDQDCKATIIVDDANLLADHLLDELAQLVLEAQNNPLWQINVVLFSHTGLIDSASVSTSPKPEFKHLTVEALSQDEANEFVEQLVIPSSHIDSEKKKQSIYKAMHSVELYPANLLDLAEHHRPPVVCWVKRSLIAIIIILLALGGWSWWTSYQARVQDQLVEVDSAAESVSQVVEPESAVSGADSSVSAADDSQVSNNEKEETLPQAVTDKTLTVGDESESEQKRVVVPANVVDALLDGDAPKDAKVTNSEVEATQAVPTLDNGSIVLADKELLAVPETRYTLQLAAVTQEKEAINFINMYDLDGKVRVYRTLRNQVHWYIVTYQDFANIQETRDAAQELPLSLQKEQPWPKSMAQVHQEIERTK